MALALGLAVASPTPAMAQSSHRIEVPYDPSGQVVRDGDSVI